MDRRPVIFVLSSVLGILGCGKSVAEDGDDAADETDQSESETDGGTCEIEFEEPAPGTSGMFTIRNDRAVTIYIPQSISTCTFEAWQVLEGETQLYWNDAYVPTCMQLLADDCNWGCSDGPASAIKLEPGATWTEAWGYYVWAPVELTAGCLAGSGCEAGGTCWAGRAKLDGQLTARLRVTETCTFADTCDCAGTACLIAGDSISIGETDAEVVDIEFDASSNDILLAIQ